MRIPFKALLVLLTSLALPAMGQAANQGAPFAKLRDRSKPVAGLTAFLDKYVGNCDGIDDRQSCLQNARQTREEMNGKTYYLILDERASAMLKPAGFNPANRQFRLDLTPFFEGGGRALTEGEPKGQDAQGRPRIPLMPLSVELPDDATPMDMERLLRTGNVRIQLIFKPLGVWTLPGKGRDKREGVKAKFLAVRLTNQRNGDQLALHLAK